MLFRSNPTPADPNNPGLGRGQSAQGHRVFWQATYSKQYFGFGSTTIAAFWDAHPSFNGGAYSSNGGYVFAGDMNGDGAVLGDDIQGFTNCLFGGGVNSRLYQALVLDKQLATGAGADYEPGMRDLSTFGVAASLRPDANRCVAPPIAPMDCHAK